MSTNDQSVVADYLGMALQIDATDHVNKAFFRHCANGEFKLQCCADCGLYRYPPGTACPWCASPESKFENVPTAGTVYSYAEVHHAIQPAFADLVPYAYLIVELDFQRDNPNHGDAIRVAGNLADDSGDLIHGKALLQVGIGSRMKMVFKRISADIALPMWALDTATDEPWRYPLESIEVDS